MQIVISETKDFKKFYAQFCLLIFYFDFALFSKFSRIVLSNLSRTQHSKQGKVDLKRNKIDKEKQII